MTRGKCQACGIYASLERVLLQVRGRNLYDGMLCRRCANTTEDAVREIMAVTRSTTR